MTSAKKNGHHALTMLLHPEETPMTIPPPNRRSFVSYYEYAIQRLLASGITANQLESLWDFGLLAMDNVTGYFEGRSGKARMWTLKEAIRHVKETEEEAYYIEMDLRNLGGLNAVLGHSQANEVFSDIADIIRRTLSSVASDAVFFRHGGDEICAFLIDAKKQAILAAFEQVHENVAKLAADYNVDDIPHPKHPANKDMRGVGIHAGIIQLSLRHEKDATLVFREADIELERSKVKGNPADYWRDDSHFGKRKSAREDTVHEGTPSNRSKTTPDSSSL